MKAFSYILLLILFLSCNQSLVNKKPGHVDLKYSSYIWLLTEQQKEFHLADYLHIDSTGHFKLIRHNNDTLDRYFYFSGTINDSVKHIIDSMLLENKYLPGINRTDLPDTPLVIYNGFTYLLDYKIDTGRVRNKIQYINSSSRVPRNILFITSLLDTVIAQTKLNKTDSFSISAYIDTLKKISSYNLPPLPEPPPINKTGKKFRVPGYKP